MSVRRAYLDHASTSPLRAGAAREMSAIIDSLAAGNLGDPSRIHHEGLAARDLLEHFRERIAQCLGARPREVVLCSGGTEAVTTAALWLNSRPGAIALGAIEHRVVRECAAEGAHVLGVDRFGVVNASDLEDLAPDEIAGVHLQWVNHEVGTIQPIDEVAQWCHQHRVILHVDAAQALATQPVSFGTQDVDLMSISGHKVGGPPGAGVLLVRRGVRIDPILRGGDQERARRAGLENLVAAGGLAGALEELQHQRASEVSSYEQMHERVRSWVHERDGVELIGSNTQFSPHIVCLGLDGIEPQPVLIGLDRLGVSVNSGSSCSSEAFEPSPVLDAIGVNTARSLRLSFGWSTTHDDVERCLAALDRVLDELAALRG